MSNPTTDIRWKYGLASLAIWCAAPYAVIFSWLAPFLFWAGIIGNILVLPGLVLIWTSHKTLKAKIVATFVSLLIWAVSFLVFAVMLLFSGGGAPK